MKIDYQETPLNLPEMKRGKFAITKSIAKQGETLTVVSLRTAIFTGVPALQIVLEKDRVIHYLKCDGDTMMSDIPQEMYDHEKPIVNAKGNVLVGGLGLGYYISQIAKKKSVKSITVVETEKDIIEMMKPFIDPKVKIVHADLFEYLKTKPEFDYAYIDIWYMTGESEWLDSVLPLQRLIRKLYDRKKVDYWKEGEMLGQIVQSCYGVYQHLLMLKKLINLDEWKHYIIHYAFARKLNDISSNPKMIGDEIVKHLVQCFIKDIGSKLWENSWDWDHCVDVCNEARGKIYDKAK